MYVERAIRPPEKGFSIVAETKTPVTHGLLRNATREESPVQETIVILLVRTHEGETRDVIAIFH